MKQELSSTFACSGCWGFFKDMKKLDRHKEITQNKPCVMLRQNKCGDCNKSFKTEDLLESHKNNCKPRVCPICGILCINKKKLIKHGLCHKTFVCSSCLIVFKNMILLNRHVNQKRCVMFRTNKCENCSKRFKTKDRLVTHKNSCQKPSVCLTCGKVCQSQNKLTNHMVSHNNERAHCCNVCEASFKRDGDLRLHLKIHSGQKDFECSDCDETFITSSALITHKVTHNEMRPFSCDICGLTFKLKGTLKKHTLVHEEREKTYVCSICEKAFHVKANMRYHEKTHSNDSPYKCPVCGSCYGQISYLKTHLDRCHNNQDEVMAFKCLICNKGYPKNYLVNRHMKIHKVKISSKPVHPHQCDKCDKSFKKRYTLIKHRQRDHGVLPLAQVKDSL